MRRVFALAVAFGVAHAVPAWGDPPEDQYLAACNLIREADALGLASEGGGALPKYPEAREALQRIQQGFPDWNAEIIRYRLSYLTNRVTKLAVAPGKETGKASGASQALPPFEWEAQLAGLKEQVRQLQGEKGLLELKLREALSVMPAAADAADMARLQARAEALERQNALLEATVAQLRSQLGTFTKFSPPEPPSASTNLDQLVQSERERLKALAPGQKGTNAPARGPRTTVVRVLPQ